MMSRDSFVAPSQRDRLVKAGTRLMGELRKPVTLALLERRNRRSVESVVGDAPVVVSMTTFGRRIDRVHLAIEGIARGSILPNRFLLWLDDEAALQRLTPELERLRTRGLEVHVGANLGPHTKYFHTLGQIESTGDPLVTADDDILYPKRWLGDLLEVSGRVPGSVVCHQSKLVTFDGEELAPYRAWPQNWSTSTSPRVFALGVSGVLYPPQMQQELLRRGTEFMECTPKADDVWLHYVAVDSEISVFQVTPRPTHHTEIVTPVESRLSDANVGQGENDAQMRATYSARAMARLRANQRGSGS